MVIELNHKIFNEVICPMTYFIRCSLITVLFSGVFLLAHSASSQNGVCKWDAQLSQAMFKYEKYLNGQYEADDADILLPLGYREMNCLLDSIIKKEKYDFNPYNLLWLTEIPDSVFYLSPASVKYLVENKNKLIKNAGRLLVNEKMKKKYSIDNNVIEKNTTIKNFDWFVFF